MARTKQTARKSTGGRAPLKAPAAFMTAPDPSSTREMIKHAREFPAELLGQGAPRTLEQEQLKTAEAAIRTQLVSPNAGDVDAHASLLNPFAPDEEKKFLRVAESPEEQRQVHVLTKFWDVRESGRAICASQAVFEQRLNEFAAGAFAGMQWDNVFLAGGAALACMMADGDMSQFENSDVDLFVVGITDEEQATRKVKEIYDCICRAVGRKALVVRTLRAINIIGVFPERHIQVILRLYRSPAEVLLGFDIDACAVGYDGKQVWCMERFRRALTKRYNLVDHSRRSLSYESRLAKYSTRGFAVVIPDFDATAVDVNAIRFTAPEKLQGARKLIALDLRQRRNFAKNMFLSSLRKDGPEGDYSIELERKGEPLDAAKKLDRAANYGLTKGKHPTKHQHVFVTSIEGITQPNFGWCRLCRQKTPLDNNPDTDAHTPFVTPHIQWIKDSPVFQDFENGKVRRMALGSFQVGELNPDWYAEVYRPDAKPAPSSAPVRERQLGISYRPVQHPTVPEAEPVTFAAPHIAAPSSRAAELVDQEVPGRFDYRVLEQDGKLVTAILGHVSIPFNSNRFYIMQVLTKVSDGTVHTFCRWGRVGQVGKTSFVQCSSTSEAMSFFRSKFLDHTGCSWGELFVRHKDKFHLLPDLDSIPTPAPPSNTKIVYADSPVKATGTALMTAARPTRDVASFEFRSFNTDPVADAAPAPPSDVSAFDGRRAPATPDVSAFDGRRAPSTPSVSAFGGRPMPATPDVAAFGGPSGASSGASSFGGHSHGGHSHAAHPIPAEPQRFSFGSAGMPGRPPQRPPQPRFGVADAAEIPPPVQAAVAGVGAVQPVEHVRARALFQHPDKKKLASVLACGTTPHAKALLALQYLHRCGALSTGRKQILKRKALSGDAVLHGMVLAYELDDDVDELLDSLSMI